MIEQNTKGLELTVQLISHSQFHKTQVAVLAPIYKQNVGIRAQSQRLIQCPFCGGAVKGLTHVE